MNFSPRLQTVRKQLQDNQAILFSSSYDLYYLTDFVTLTPDEREAFLLITPNSASLFLSSFSCAMKTDSISQQVMDRQNPLTRSVQQILEQQKLNSLIIDAATLSANEYLVLRQKLPKSIELITEPKPIFSTLRMVKDEQEIENLRKANQVTHQAIQETFAQLEQGQTELEVCNFLEKQFLRLGSKQLAFPTIVAFGEHTALPHHQPTDRKLKTNQPVLIDCGAKWQQYCADVTRTIWFGDQHDEEFAKIEKTVQEAYDATVAKLQSSDQNTKHLPADATALQAGKPQNTDPTEPSELTTLTARDLDDTCRKIITDKGYGKQFIHTTGHGVGLYIHEQPSLNWKNETIIKPGMVITIEPGIYLEGKFGYRHENSVLVRENGYEELGL